MITGASRTDVHGISGESQVAKRVPWSRRSLRETTALKATPYRTTTLPHRAEFPANDTTGTGLQGIRRPSCSFPAVAGWHISATPGFTQQPSLEFLGFEPRKTCRATLPASNSPPKWRQSYQQQLDESMQVAPVPKARNCAPKRH